MTEPTPADEAAPEGVVISWMFPERTSGWFTYSLVDMFRHDGQGPGHLFRHDSGIISLSTGPRLHEARNLIVDIFATKHPESQWLLMLDSDMTFSPTLLEKLMAVADPVERPIVGGLCFAGGKMNDPYPTIYRSVQKGSGDAQYASIERVYDYPRDSLVKVAATGGACLLMHRSALAKMKEHYGTKDGVPQPYPWFAEGAVGPEGEAWGEDTVFCLRAGAVGIPIHVHTGIKLGHVKAQIIDEAYYDAFQEQKAAGTQLGDPLHGLIDLGEGAGRNGDNPVTNSTSTYSAQTVTPNRAQRRAAARAKAT